VFYPGDLPQKRELSYASRALSSLEVNGTYYSTFKPATWRTWHDATPDDFVFSVKGARYCTNRKQLADAGPSITRFLSQGLTELGPKLGPIVWQFMPTKKLDEPDVEAFLAMLPQRFDGLALRHAIEARHPSFASTAFYDLARRHGVAIVYTNVDDHPALAEPTAGFTYARLRATRPELNQGLTSNELSTCARSLRTWSRQGDVFAYFISGAKVRNPAAAIALIGRLATPSRKRKRS
jgi:uncharacterized protein YecE (DUF72 family)